ncbi:down syndrome cell adhesion molecule [Elysia marginata]|uniref:Down syndrome cell adhesion molecule n=1 Tax=Elysia marginata TaxID=1093978 RepID=A0AAV4FN87_9GAST|nr:down syndrome cell adhesion molecule [Elysia marginata]
MLQPPTRVAFANTQGADISCTASGRPAPELDWVREDGSAVDNIPDLVTVLPNNTLRFHPFPQASFMTTVHKGVYRCLASNAAGTIVSNNVTVRAVLLGISSAITSLSELVSFVGVAVVVGGGDVVAVDVEDVMNGVSSVQCCRDYRQQQRHC